MAEFNQFGSVRPIQSADAKQCSHFEAMLAEAIDGTLSAEDQAAFDQHLIGCANCSEMLADAKRGSAWLGMLRQHAPEPPAAMLERIFAQTSGAQAAGSGERLAEAGGLLTMGAPGVLEAVGASTGGTVIPFPRRVVQRFNFRAATHTLLQPRLAMTAAMAFFSIALTLNLTGVRLSELRMSDLKPSSLKRSLYEADAHVVRYYTNLRVVYELESRVRDLQRSSEDELPASSTQAPETDNSGKPDSANPAPGKKGQELDQQPKRRSSPGTSQREPMREERRVLAERSLSTTDADDVLALLLPRVDLHTQERGTV